MELENIRREYNRESLNDASLNSNPFEQFSLWLEDAVSHVEIDPTAMVLSTVAENKRPSSRIVLLKNFSENGFTFFTNYESKKGMELGHNAQASLLFFWKELERQIRIEGRVEKTDAKTSDEYFESRPFESRIAAVVSNQSKLIEDRDKLDVEFQELKQHKEIKRPEYWGGYILMPDYFEFWQGRTNRLHDRIVYELEDEQWKIKRLAP